MSQQNIPPLEAITWRVRLSQFLAGLISVHPSITRIEEIRKARLLATLSLVISVMLINALIVRVDNSAPFIFMLAIALSSYLLSRTSFYRLGAYLLSYAFTASGFISIYNGTASTAELAVVTTVHVALVFSSVLLSQRGYLWLVILTSLATFSIPLYSSLPEGLNANYARTGGVVLSIGLILYSINVFRSSVEREQLNEVVAANKQLEEFSASLEERVQARTQELKETSEQLQQRSERLQAIADISQEITDNITQKPDEVLGRITQIISRKLGYYHVGIFLLDREKEYAILRAANSRGGQQMLARRHQLKVGGTGIVGNVTQSGRPRIALDTSSDVVFFNNPDLPETRSEIALPLKYGNKIIGALDVQSSSPSAFNEQDIDTLSALTSQVAIVIRTLQNASEIRYETDTKGIKFSTQSFKTGYGYQPDGSVIVTTLPEKDDNIIKAIASGETVILNTATQGDAPALAVPVKYRDEIIGLIHVKSSESIRNWTEDEVALVQAISDRAALALENARLLEESQKRANKEQVIGEISTKISAGTDIESILRTAVRELGSQISGTQVTLEIGDGKK